MAGFVKEISNYQSLNFLSSSKNIYDLALINALFFRQMITFNTFGPRAFAESESRWCRKVKSRWVYTQICMDILQNFVYVVKIATRLINRFTTRSLNTEHTDILCKNE